MKFADSPLSIQLTNKNRNGSDATVSTIVPGVEQQCLSVILVEDDDVDSEIVRRALNSFSPGGYEIHQVSSLSEAIRTITKTPYDIILLDLGLKDCASLDAVGSLVSFVKAPIVVLTGSEDREVAFKALQLGAQDFLSKSDNLRLILPKTIQFAIERYRTQEDLVRTEELHARQAEWEQRSNERLRSQLAAAESRAAMAEKSDQCVAILDKNGVNWINQALGQQLNCEQKPANISQAFPDIPAATVLEIEQAIRECKPFTYAWLAQQDENSSTLKRVELLAIEESTTVVQQFILSMSTDRVAVC